MFDEIRAMFAVHIIKRFLKPLYASCSSIVRAMIQDFLVEGYRNAIATSNPNDDILIEVLIEALDIDIPRELQLHKENREINYDEE